MAVWFEHIVTFGVAVFAVAFGEYVPSQYSITCSEYHCLMPIAPDSLSATSPSMAYISLWIDAVILLICPVIQDVMDDSCGAAFVVLLGKTQ